MELPPTFKDSPLSAIVPLPKETKPNYPLLWMWADMWGETLQPYNAEVIERLARDGWEKAESTSILQSQLYTCLTFIDETEKRLKESWYDSRLGEPAPVVLAFSIASNPPPTPVYMLNPLPLPQHGEYALVMESDREEVAAYYILELPLEARQRWVALNEAINRLSEPLKWPQFTQEHRLASHEVEYQTRMQAFKTGPKLALPTHVLNEIIAEHVALEAAHIHINNLRSALKKPDWRQQWQGVQTMARELARDYYSHHKKIQAQARREQEISLSARVDGKGTLEGSLTVEVPEKQAKKQRSKQATTPIIARGQTTIQHNSLVAQWEIIVGLRDKDKYTLYPDHNSAEHQHSFMQDKGHMIITISAQDEEKWETVIHALNTLGDGCIDTYIAVNAIALEQNGTESNRIRTPILVSPDDILAICGKEKSHGSYTPFQRAEVVKHLKTLSQTRVRMTMPGQAPKKRGPRRKGAPPHDGVLRVEGALIDLGSFKIGEYDTITGEEIWEKRSISVGPWITMLPDIHVKYAILFRRLLAYSGKNRRYQKRIGLYLSQMFRVNARHQGQFPNGISMSALLEGAGIIPDRWRAGEFRDSVEKAIQQLKDDGIISAYWKIVDDTPASQKIEQEIEQHAKGWFDYYLQQKWNFAPPQSILDQYKNILKEAKKPDEKGSTSL